MIRLVQLCPYLLLLAATAQLGQVLGLKNLTIYSQDASIDYQPRETVWNPVGDSNAMGRAIRLARTQNGVATLSQTFRSLYVLSPLWPWPMEMAITVGSDANPITIDLQDHSAPLGTPPPTGMQGSTQTSRVVYAFSGPDAQRTVQITSRSTSTGWIALVDAMIFEVAEPGDPPAGITSPPTSVIPNSGDLPDPPPNGTSTIEPQEAATPPTSLLRTTVYSIQTASHSISTNTNPIMDNHYPPGTNVTASPLPVSPGPSVGPFGPNTSSIPGSGAPLGDDEGRKNTVLLIIAVLCGVLGLILFVGLVFWCIKRRTRKVLDTESMKQEVEEATAKEEGRDEEDKTTSLDQTADDIEFTHLATFVASDSGPNNASRSTLHSTQAEDVLDADGRVWPSSRSTDSIPFRYSVAASVSSTSSGLIGGSEHDSEIITRAERVNVGRCNTRASLVIAIPRAETLSNFDPQTISPSVYSMESAHHSTRLSSGRWISGVGDINDRQNTSARRTALPMTMPKINDVAVQPPLPGVTFPPISPPPHYSQITSRRLSVESSDSDINADSSPVPQNNILNSTPEQPCLPSTPSLENPTRNPCRNDQHRSQLSFLTASSLQTPLPEYRQTANGFVWNGLDGWVGSSGQTNVLRQHQGMVRSLEGYLDGIGTPVVRHGRVHSETDRGFTAVDVDNLPTPPQSVRRMMWLD
ncbi:hypothetical protein CVT24_008573 [Panaeolus cyanescens]|uniref:Mid2 domain-containing protein n=1 Tax=Panaeolus cyanescens TaxID=181874 RepID=A0A409VKS4_9AGAR|nr:hypothetical protein CVT24_008573 [Panaeolus cyanescens]